MGGGQAASWPPGWPPDGYGRRVGPLMPAGRTKAIVSANRLWQGRHLTECHVLHPLHHQLRDAVTASERDRPGLIGVQQDYLDLATVPGVHRARRVHQGDPVPGREARAGVQRAGVAVRQGDRDPSADHGPLPRPQVDVLGRRQVDAGVTGAGIARQRHLGVEPGDQHLKLAGARGRARSAGGHRPCLLACRWSARLPPSLRHATPRCCRQGAGRVRSPCGASSCRSALAALVSAAVTGTATTAPAMPAVTPATASTRITASGCSRTILPTTCGCSRCPSSWFITIISASTINAAIRPLDASTMRIAAGPAISTPARGTNAATKMNGASGATSGEPMIESVTPITMAWIAATAIVPLT